MTASLGLPATSGAQFGLLDPICRYVEQGAPGPEGNLLEVGIGNTGDVELERVDDRIRVSTLNGNVHREVRCEGTRPTVTNIDSITLLHPPFGSGIGVGDFDELSETDVELAIDLQDGLLAPGATPEPGASEIELITDGPGIPSVDLTLILTEAADHVRMHTNEKRTLANLNADEGVRDVDLALPPVMTGTVFAGDGDDRVVSRSKLGPVGFFDPGITVVAEGGDDLVKAAVQAAGGDGDDRLLGGRDFNFYIGGAGNDVLRGKHERDILIANGGRDRLFAGGGRDFVLSSDGNGDRAYCGGGRDRAWIDPGDKRGGCERVTRVPGFVIPEEILLPFESRMKTRSGRPIP